jgi:hypothetical protein
MSIKARLAFIFIGDDLTGKTKVQKYLIDRLCGYNYEKMPINREGLIIHPEIKRKYLDVSFMNRSYQEKKDLYGSLDIFFTDYFKECDIVFLSSHLSIEDLDLMVHQLHIRYYNVAGVFWSNSIAAAPDLNSRISSLNWDERFVVENPHRGNDAEIEKQLDRIAESIMTLLIKRTEIN